MKKILLPIVTVFCLGGCAALSDIDNGASKAAPPVVIVADSVANAEPVIAALEQATGKTINPAIAAKGEIVSNKVASVSKTGAGIATALGRPGIGALLAGLAALAGGVSSFFHRRRSQKIALAASKAADLSTGGGQKLVDEAEKLGVADAIKKAYYTSKG